MSDKTWSHEYASGESSADFAFPLPAEWVQCDGAGTIVLVCEDGTVFTRHAKGSEIYRGPFASLTSTTCQYLIASNAPAPTPIQSGTNASGIASTDAGGFTAQTTVEAQLQEIYQHLLSVSNPVPINIYSFREVSATGDVSNIAGNGGVLASDTTPIMLGDANNSAEIQWATGNVDPIGTSFMLPPDFDDTADAILDLVVSSGTTNAATMGVATSWNGGSEVTDSADDSTTKSATPHTISATIATADIPAGAVRVTIRLTPPTHATDTVSVYGARLRYKAKILTS